MSATKDLSDAALNDLERVVICGDLTELTSGVRLQVQSVIEEVRRRRAEAAALGADLARFLRQPVAGRLRQGLHFCADLLADSARRAGGAVPCSPPKKERG